MSHGNRGKRAAPWVIWAAGVVGISTALFGIAFGLAEQSRYLQKADEAASEYARYAAYQAYKPCRVVARPEVSKCLSDAKPEYEMKRRDNQRDYDDLFAQQKSALWAGIMGVAAIIGMILSIVRCLSGLHYVS